MIFVVTLMGVVFALSYALLDSMLSSRRAAKTANIESMGLRLAQAGVSKATYCLNSSSPSKCGGTAGSGYPGETYSLGEGSVAITVTAVDSSTKNISSTGTPVTEGKAETVLVSATTDPPTDKTIAFGNATISTGGGTYLYGTGATVRGDMRARDTLRCNDTSANVYGIAYLSTSGGLVDSCTLRGDVHSDTVWNSVALRDVYYRGFFFDLWGTTVSGTKYSGATRPPVIPLPPIDLAFWRAQAVAGGTISGNYAPSDGSTLGPVMIDGDLTVNAGVHVTLTGTVWVTGNIVMNDPSWFSLSSSFGTFGTVVLADNAASPSSKGRITIGQNVGISGSGQPGSYVLFVSTNTSTDYDNPAVRIDSSATKAAYIAQGGTARLMDNRTAAQLAGWRVYVNGGATVDFTNSSLGTARFGSYPPGTWRTISGTYREQ
ncbi:MAG: hypothetical protein RL272_1284 [Candidatus Parcubacteria bacterium]|jgi:hypothetical protein